MSKLSRKMNTLFLTLSQKVLKGKNPVMTRGELPGNGKGCIYIYKLI